jgi:hypothetical protein
MTDPAALDPGAVVVDREAAPADRNEAVVVNTPPVPADEWEIDDQTVASYSGNEAYPDDDPVACVVYREAFEGTEYDPADIDHPIPLAELDVRIYTFPASRLRVVTDRAGSADGDDGGDSDDAARNKGETLGDTGEGRARTRRDRRDTQASIPEDLAAIAAAVRERNVDGVTVDEDAGVVRVEKLATAYTIKRDGSVLDSGAFADALEDVAEDALGDGGDEGEVVA